MAEDLKPLRRGSSMFALNPKEEEKDQEVKSTTSFSDIPGAMSRRTSDAGLMRPRQQFENTYRMEPMKKFQVKPVQDIIQEVLQKHLQDEKYSAQTCRQMTKTLCTIIQSKVEELKFDRYKIVVIVMIGEMKGHGVRFGSRCLWNTETDNFASAFFKNSSLYAVGNVYGLFYE
eukprot:Colp12_sorted_trinity150504_noHs@19083